MRPYHIHYNALFLLTFLSCVGSGTASLFELAFWSLVASAAFGLLCTVPVVNWIFCGHQAALADPDCDGRPCWIETSPARTGFWGWLFPPYPPRHVVCMAFSEDSGKAYLLGGAFANYRVNIYDPVERSWSQGSLPPVMLHHTQCVAFEGKIYVVSGYTDTVPNETPISHSYVYDIATDTWETRTGLPEERQRGGAASVLYDRKIYVSHGGGHNQPALAWFDAYDIDRDEWIALPDALNARGHVGGGLVHGELMCVGGGRNQEAEGDAEGDADLILPTDCYNFSLGTWSERAALPTGRRGSGYGTTCDGKFIVTGGEGSGQTWPDVDLFDGVAWTPLDPLNRPRHGHGFAIDCACRQMYVAAGTSDLFLRTLASVETYFPNGVDEPCSAVDE